MARRGALKVTLGNGELIENEVIYVPSETEFATEEAPSMIAALYWEPESASFQHAAAQFDVSIARGFQCQYSRAGELTALYENSMTLADADTLIAKIFGLPKLAGADAASNDARIVAALTYLRATPEQYDSIDRLAERVHLSSSRFAHLFKEQVGVPVRRYVLWQKMRRALDLAMAGDSLTTAALSAGFADSAHLSRTVRAIMGVAPEFLFRHRDRLVVHQ
jgi:AraC-like DNA-binding protein